MKSEHTLGLAFFLNAAFSLFELAGGVFTGSTAILSDAVHDLGDALGIALSYVFEKRSKQQANNRYTFGYARYSVLGGMISGAMLLLGSVGVIFHALGRLHNPVDLHYNGMLIVAVVGVCVNGIAARLMHHGETLNEKTVFWHLLEDVLGWAVVLVGALVMRLTDWAWLDPLLSIGVSLFVAVHAIGHFRAGTAILLEKAPSGIPTEEILARLGGIDGVVSVEKLYIWSLDGIQHCAAVHLQTNAESDTVKTEVRAILESYGVVFCTIETCIAENVQKTAFSDYI